VREFVVLGIDVGTSALSGTSRSVPATPNGVLGSGVAAIVPVTGTPYT